MSWHATITPWYWTPAGSYMFQRKSQILTGINLCRGVFFLAHRHPPMVLDEWVSLATKKIIFVLAFFHVTIIPVLIFGCHNYIFAWVVGYAWKELLSVLKHCFRELIVVHERSYYQYWNTLYLSCELCMKGDTISAETLSQLSHKTAPNESRKFIISLVPLELLYWLIYICLSAITMFLI